MAVESTKPKPFIFVLMPINDDFSDVYEVAIKSAAVEAGAYAERVDDQHFSGSILDRILNQINTADILVADMTGKNANVFYEVGYAHALGKTVILMTQQINDIPFDLKHRQHIEYRPNQLSSLRSDLLEKIKWALEQRTNQEIIKTGRLLDLSVMDIAVPVYDQPTQDDHTFQVITGNVKKPGFTLPCLLKNVSAPPTTIYGQLMLFTKSTSLIVPTNVATKQPLHPYNARSLSIDYGLDSFYPLANKTTGALAPSGIAPISLDLMLKDGVKEALETLLIRVQYSARVENFYFKLNIKLEEDVMNEGAPIQ